MSTVSLRLLAREPGGLGDFRLAIHGADERVAVWNGVPPPDVGPHANVAAVVLEGEVDGRRAYAEAVPRGVRPSVHPPPPELLGFIVAEILVGLQFLHDAGEVHGGVGPDRIVLGTRGEVILVGRGRQGGHARLDWVSALSLLPRDAETTLLEADASRLGAQMRAQSPPGARGLLAAWVRGVIDEGRVVEEIHLGLAEAADAVDEIVPDLGPDLATGGILDQFTGTSTPGITTGEVTAGDVTLGEVTAPEVTAADVTSDGLSDQDSADGGTSLWSALSSPLSHPAPAGRFDAVKGVPSAGLRSLLEREGLDALVGPLVGTIGPFVVANPRYEDQPTMVGPMGFTEPPPARRTRPPSVPRAPWMLILALAAAGLGALMTWWFLG